MHQEATKCNNNIFSKKRYIQHIITIFRRVGKDHDHVISQSMMSKYIDKYTIIIAENLAPKYIQFPETQAEIEATQHGFEESYGFPDIIGVLDCSHVNMAAASRNQAAALRNRKGNYSVNAQIVCDSRLYISSVNARYPGSTHDAFIFNSSALKDRLQWRYAQNPNAHFWLLGMAFLNYSPQLSKCNSSQFTKYELLGIILKATQRTVFHLG